MLKLLQCKSTKVLCATVVSGLIFCTINLYGFVSSSSHMLQKNNYAAAFPETKFPENSYINGVASDGNQVIIVGNDLENRTGIIYHHSNNGTWEKLKETPEQWSDFYDIAWNKDLNKWIAVGRHIWYGSNGSDWYESEIEKILKRHNVSRYMQEL